jgi:cardiolipin synthase
MAMPAYAASTADRFLRVLSGGPTGRRPGAAQRRLLQIAHQAGLELCHASRLELLHRGDDHFERLVQAIDGARREISLEMYQIRPDGVGLKVCAALAGAVQRGVQVRLLLDRFGSARVAGWIAGLRAAGIDARWYNPWRPWRDPLHRTHRKLLVVDGCAASIGGINLAAEFSESHRGRDAWRDVALWLEGPAAWQLRRQFDVAWHHHGGPPAPPIPAPGESGVLCALAGPRLRQPSQGSAYLALAGAARRELLLATPYFLPTVEFREALCAAARRGVRVAVALPRRSDIALFKHCARHLYHGLLHAGVAIWERCDRMVHAKVAVVDGEIAALGSTNLNGRSFRGNSETLLLTTEPTVVDGVRRLIAEESLARSEVLEPAGWLSHPDRRRLVELASLPMRLVF